MPVRVAVVGGINMDLVVAAPTLPRPGETIRGSGFQRFGGGKGANQSIAAARLGAYVSLVGRVGDDDFGTVLLEDLGREGVDLSMVRRVDGPNGIALITVDAQGANMMVVAPGANDQLSAEDVDAARPASEQSQSLLLQLEVPLVANVRVAQIVRQAGVATYLNPSPAAPLPDELLEGLSFLVLNEAELQTLTDGSMDPAGLLRRGVEAVVLTLGERGARLISGQGTFDVPPFRVQSVDTTAAGDAFLGALATTLPERGLVAALDAAAAAGALATTRWGAQPSLPTLADVDALIRAGRSS